MDFFYHKETEIDVKIHILNISSYSIWIFLYNFLTAQIFSVFNIFFSQVDESENEKILW